MIPTIPRGVCVRRRVIGRGKYYRRRPPRILHNGRHRPFVQKTVVRTKRFNLIFIFPATRVNIRILQYEIALVRVFVRACVRVRARSCSSRDKVLRAFPREIEYAVLAFLYVRIS